MPRKCYLTAPDRCHSSSPLSLTFVRVDDRSPCRPQRAAACRPQVEWGIDLQTEHERYLTEEVFKAPIIVYNYPKEIKAFYMRLNDDEKTVAAMDVLVPKVGALLGLAYMKMWMNTCFLTATIACGPVSLHGRVGVRHG